MKKLSFKEFMKVLERARNLGLVRYDPKTEQIEGFTDSFIGSMHTVLQNSDSRDVFMRHYTVNEDDGIVALLFQALNEHVGFLSEDETVDLLCLLAVVFSMFGYSQVTRTKKIRER